MTYLRQELRNATGLGSLASLKAIFRNGETLVSLENIPLHQLVSVCQSLGWPEEPPLSPARAGSQDGEL